jgi:hypothetical protein
MLTETLHAGGFIVQESPGFMSRDQVTIALSQTLVAGQVLGSTAVAAGVTLERARPMPATPADPARSRSTSPRRCWLAPKTAPTARSASSRPPTAARSRCSIPRGVDRQGAGRRHLRQPDQVRDRGCDRLRRRRCLLDRGRHREARLELQGVRSTATDGAQRGGRPVRCHHHGRLDQKAGDVMRRATCEVRASDLTWPGGISRGRQGRCDRRPRGARHHLPVSVWLRKFAQPAPSFSSASSLQQSKP